jgi:hypothetical protein
VCAVQLDALCYAVGLATASLLTLQRDTGLQSDTKAISSPHALVPCRN